MSFAQTISAQSKYSQYSPTNLKFTTVGGESADTNYQLDLSSSLTIEFRVKTAGVLNILHQSRTSNATAFSIGTQDTSLVYFGGVQFGNKADLLDDLWHKVVIYYSLSTNKCRLFIDDIFKVESTNITFTDEWRYTLNVNNNRKGTGVAGDMNLEYLRFYRGDFSDVQLQNLDKFTAFKRFEFTKYTAWKMVDYGNDLTTRNDGDLDKVGDINTVWINDAQEQQAPADFKFRVIFDGGQSNNFFGFRLRDQVEFSPNSRIKQLGRYAPNVDIIIDAIEPLDSYNKATSNGGIGHALGFAKQVIHNKKINDYDQIVIIASGRGGSGFINNFWGLLDPLYLDGITQTNLFFINYPNSEMFVFLWQQGEADITLTQKQYESYLVALIDGFRSSITTATYKTPFIIGQMVPQWMDDAGTVGARNVDNAQKKVVSSIRTYCYFASAENPTIPKLTFATPDELLHYDAVGQNELLKRYYLSRYGSPSNIPGIQELTFTELTSSSVKISCSVENVLGYKIYVNEAFRENVNQAMLSDYLISGLSTTTNYRIYVKAFTPNYQSMSSNVLPIATL